MRPDYFDIVRRTAQHGLDEAASYSKDLARAKWLAIWALDLTGEMNEADMARIRHRSDSEQYKTEIGDVCWAIAAIQLLFEQTQEDFEERIQRVKYSAKAITDKGNLSVFVCEVGEMCKKLARDGEDCWDPDVIFDNLAVIYLWLEKLVDVEECIELMHQKLLKRYPSGYNAQASVNRIV